MLAPVEIPSIIQCHGKVTVGEIFRKWGEDPKITTLAHNNECFRLVCYHYECTTTGMSLFTTILKAVRPLVPDAAVQWGAREFFNHRYNLLGTMTTLQIDSTNKKASFDLELKGETQPVRITINQYKLTSEGGKTLIEVTDIDTSREWLTVLARQFMNGKKFEVPEVVRAVL